MLCWMKGFIVDDMVGWCMNGRYEILMMALLLLCQGWLKVKATKHRHTYIAIKQSMNKAEKNSTRKGTLEHWNHDYLYGGNNG